MLLKFLEIAYVLLLGQVQTGKQSLQNKEIYHLRTWFL